jgi:hypothetical protein
MGNMAQESIVKNNYKNKRISQLLEIIYGN